MKTIDIRFERCGRQKKKIEKAGFFLAFMLLVFVSCGIDDEPYLEPIDPSGVNRSLTGATVSVGSSGEEAFSPAFLLYYKIYMSSASESATITSADMSRINATLGSDYSGINTYTPLNTTNRPVFTPTVFSNRNFYPMTIGTSETFSGSETITLNFDNQPNQFPSLQLNGEPLTLYRSTGGGSFVPLPETERRFRNYSELTNTQNKDVAQNSGGGDNSYCAVYIIKRGVNSQTLSAIYSAPTFIAVFRLPDRY
jgi:hypothetical protein